MKAKLDRSIFSGCYREYAYDIHGNRIEIDRNGQVETVGVASRRNRLADGTYDASGNLEDYAGVFTFSWDGNNTLMASSGPDFQKAYLYTADDERLATIDLTELSEGLVRESWTLRGLGSEVLRSWETENGTWSWQRDYIYRGTQLAASETPDDDGPLHYHLDHLSSPRLITTSTGAMKSRHVYFPFGPEHTPPGEEKLKFTGHERDQNGTLVGAADDFDYMHARYCLPDFGRFMSVDPIDSAAVEEPQSWNQYVYARGNPLRLIDPDGREIKVPKSLRSTVEKGVAGSARFRDIFNRLNREPPERVNITLRRVVRARANTFAESGLERKYLPGKEVRSIAGNVLLPFKAARDPSVIGHELVHVEELLNLPFSLEELTKRDDIWRSAGGAGIESQQAKDVEDEIAAEIEEFSGVIEYRIIWTCERRFCTGQIRAVGGSDG